MGLFKRRVTGQRHRAPSIGLRFARRVERDTSSTARPAIQDHHGRGGCLSVHVIGAKPGLDKEFWMYKNVPSRGRVTHIAIAHGVLETVKVPTRGAPGRLVAALNPPIVLVSPWPSAGRKQHFMVCSNGRAAGRGAGHPLPNDHANVADATSPAHFMIVSGQGADTRRYTGV